MGSAYFIFKHILEGSVQRAGDRVRITAQLIDATTDYHMWSENYDRDLADIFALQDEITVKLMNAMAGNLTDGEQALLYRDEFKNIKAYDKYLRGLECFYRFNRQHNAQARRFFEQASKLEETSALIFAALGFTHIFDFIYSWGDSPLISFEETEKNANKALDLNDSLDMPHILMSWIHLFKKEHGKGVILAKRAVALNPNGADALAHLGFLTSGIGEPEKAIIYLKKAFRLNPIPQSYYYHFLSIAYSMVGQYEKAIETANQGLNINPEALPLYIFLSSYYIELNDFDKAQKTANKVLEIEPNFSLEYYKNVLPIKDQSRLERFIGNLRKAGLPD